MVTEIKNIRLYKILLEHADELIKDTEMNEDKLFTTNKELKALNRKHSGLQFFLYAAGLSLLCFVALRMMYVIIPKDFPYYYLCPIPGIIIELVLRNKFIKNEKKYTEKSLKGEIKECQAVIDNNIKELKSMVTIIEEGRKKLTNLEGLTVDNIQALNYVARNENEYNKVSFEVRYNEFINKIEHINEEKYPELMVLKKEVEKYDDITIYRNIVLNKLKEEVSVNEEDNNPVSDTKEA